MKKYKFLTVFIVFTILISAVLPATASAYSEPDIDAKASILIELNSGKTLYANNEHEQLAMASVTKVMTTLLAVIECEKDDELEDSILIAPSDIYDNLTDDSSTAGIEPGEEISFGDLLYCVMLASANEGCNFVADVVAGSVEAFVDMMNEKAQELGCEDTHFMNPHGLSEYGHYTSAYDMALIMKEATQHPMFVRLISTAQYTVPSTNVSGERDLKNTNRLIDSHSDYFSEYCIGGKTGYTSEAGYCLATYCESDDKALISVVLGADELEVPGEDEYDDPTYIIQSFAETKRLVEWGVENFAWQVAVSEGQDITSVPVLHGDGSDSVKLCASQAVSVFTHISVTPSDYKIETRLTNPDENGAFMAPIMSGDSYGEASVYLDGELCGTVRLLARNSVQLRRSEYMKERLKQAVNNKTVKLILIIFIIILVAYFAFAIYVSVLKAKKKRERRARNEKLRRERAAYLEQLRSSRSISEEEMRAITARFGGAQAARQSADTYSEQRTAVFTKDSAPARERIRYAPPAAPEPVIVPEPEPVPEYIPEEEPAFAEYDLSGEDNRAIPTEPSAPDPLDSFGEEQTEAVACGGIQPEELGKPIKKHDFSKAKESAAAFGEKAKAAAAAAGKALKAFGQKLGPVLAAIAVAVKAGAKKLVESIKKLIETAKAKAEEKKAQTPAEEKSEDAYDDYDE